MRKYKINEVAGSNNDELLEIINGMVDEHEEVIKTMADESTRYFEEAKNRYNELNDEIDKLNTINIDISNKYNKLKQTVEKKNSEILDLQLSVKEMSTLLYAIKSIAEKYLD